LFFCIFYCYNSTVPDNDGDLDLFTGVYGNLVNYFKNTGSPFNPVFTKQTGDNNMFNALGGDQRIFSPVKVDVDGDGMDDIVGGLVSSDRKQGRLRYFKRTKSTTQSLSYTSVPNPFKNLGIAGKPQFLDLDSDGDLDLLVGTRTGYIDYFKNIGERFNPVYSKQTGADNPFQGVFLTAENDGTALPFAVDIDADGDMDMFLGTSKDKGQLLLLDFYKNVGTPTLAIFEKQADSANPTHTLLSTHSSGNGHRSPYFMDFDSDGDQDLFVGGCHWSKMDVEYFKNEGTPQNAVFVKKDNENVFRLQDICESSLEAVDIDADGDMDIFVGSYDQDILYYKNEGGTYVKQENNKITTKEILGVVLFGSTPRFIDMDGDGKLELFVAAGFSATEGFKLFSPTRCVLESQCTRQRGTCEFSSFSDSKCNCYGGMASGAQCQSCPKGKLERKYIAGQNMEKEFDPKCQSCPIGYWSSIERYDESAVCKACETGRKFNQSYEDLGTSADVCVFCGTGRHQNENGTAYCVKCIPGK
jgi:hypothetical protein